MDTKLKKFNNSLWMRIFAFIMCILLATTTLVSGMMALVEIDKSDRSFYFEDLWTSDKYEGSAEMRNDFQYITYNLAQIACYYKSEENIRQGKLLNETDGRLENMMQELFYNGSYYANGKEIKAVAVPLTINGKVYNYSNGQLYIQQETEAVQEDLAYSEEQGSTDFNNPTVRAAFIQANKSQIEELKASCIKEQLREFEQLKESLNSQEGMYYYVTNGTEEFSNESSNAKNRKNQFKDYKAYMMYEDGKLTSQPDWGETNNMSTNHSDFQSLEDDLFSNYSEGLTVYIGFDSSFMQAKQEAYQKTGNITDLLVTALAAGLLCVVFLIYLMVMTGPKDEKGVRKLYAADHLWTEAQLAIIGLALFGGAGTFAVIWEWHYNVSMTGVPLACLIVGILLCASIGLWYVLSCVRLLKAHMVIKTSLIYKLWHLVIHRLLGKIWVGMKAIYTGGSLMRKVVLCSIAVCLLSATIFLAPVVLVAILVFAPKWVNRVEEIKNGLEEVRNGNLSHKIPVNGVGELDQFAKSINEISEASNIAIQNELKNQRLKTELISNVSHDLKTPLTSMVTYIDLLKKEGLTSENAEEYLRVLDEKTERLRRLTEDLFEAAKASSGAIPVQLEKVELLSLINQGLGEMEQKITASGLEFIVNAEEEKYYVLADGQLLWRVVENLFGNVLKCALERSRVYIDIKEIKTKSENSINVITLEMKNISKNPLNISADELMERFKRGDESRTTEGSGLGLAIAKDLVKLQDGWFDIIIDGDLFKAQVMLTKYQGKK